MSKTINPLAHARQGDGKAEDVWYSKSGDAYPLFIEYYSKQPIGTVCGAATSRNSARPVAVVVAQQGQSRASKRRKRKRSTISSSDAMEAPAIQEKPSIDLPRNEKLMDALQKHYSTGPCLDFFYKMAEPLPITFRIRKTVSRKQRVELKATIDKLQVKEVFESVFQASIPKTGLKDSHPELHEFLLENSQNGSIARQELVSMIPVWAVHALRSDSTSRILDLCAAPGSKTLQAAELYVSVRANDVNPNRLQALQDAVERSGMHVSLKYSNYDASQYPIPQLQHRMWDIVLCDVPCSGDGTIRKDPQVLQHWKPSTSHSLHCLQVKILQRALRLSTDIVCYSTCSLNPIENEAVVAAVLESNSSFALVPFPKLSGLKYHSGVNHWKVADYDTQEDTAKLSWYPKFDESVKHAVPTLWSSSATKRLHLEYCARFWPTDHDSGGFFVALLRRKK